MRWRMHLSSYLPKEAQVLDLLYCPSYPSQMWSVLALLSLVEVLEKGWVQHRWSEDRHAGDET